MIILYLYLHTYVYFSLRSRQADMLLSEITELNHTLQLMLGLNHRQHLVLEVDHRVIEQLQKLGHSYQHRL